VLENGALDTVRCTRPVHKQTSHSREFDGPTRLKFTGLSGESAEQWLPARQRSTADMNSDEQCRAEVRAAKSEVTGHVQCATGLLKGKCALGPFLSILVIECQHKWTYVNLCKVMDKVQIK
jgi:hypothetical protein